MKEIKRTLYLNKIDNFINKPIAKIIIGMRRVGKSTILRQILKKLKEKHKNSNFIYINKEDIEFDFIKNYEDLCNFIKTKSNAKTKNYIFIDEIQEIIGWEKCIASLLLSRNNDIYITGSNSTMLSSELSSLLSGRYVLFPVYPLTFKEFLDFRGKKNQDLKKEFKNFIKFGGLPGIHYFDLKEDITFQYLGDIYNSIILNDVVKRYSIRNVALLENIYYFLMDNIGNITSANKIKNYIKEKGLKTSVESILNYFHYLISAFSIFKIQNWDLKGKKILEFNDKYYAGDLGIMQFFNRNSSHKLPGILENIVFLELKSRGYKIFSGRMNNYEIDFIAQKDNTIEYYQVSYLIKNKSTFDREYSPLMEIRDHYPKFVITMDEIGDNLKGIKWLNIIDWLLS